MRLELDVQHILRKKYWPTPKFNILLLIYFDSFKAQRNAYCRGSTENQHLNDEFSELMFSIVLGGLTAGIMRFHILYATTKSEQINLNIIQQNTT